uniref:rRNA biogenesis protein RRP36 n=1 Tax=Blastobotrys adeninivorans TaxID=409370 RepID=A0A060T732_BLAAD
MISLTDRMKRPQYQESDSEPELDEFAYSQEEDSDGEFGSVSFGALAKAQDEFGQGDEDDDSDSGPEETSTSSSSRRKGKFSKDKQKRHKHAPAESSAKRPVSVIREIPGLSSTKSTTLYRDIRFDPAYGKADLATARKNYAFLNEYRQKELDQLKEELKTVRDANERERIQKAIQSQQSRLETLKNRDLENKVVKEHQKKGHFLKRSDKRQLVLKEKYKSMKKKDVSKAIERRRKKNAAKERKNMPLVRRS